MRRLLIPLLLLVANAVAQERRITVEKFEAPKYPPIARMAGVESTVKLELEVGEDGEVKSAKVLTGHPMLRGVALENIRSWHFSCFNCKTRVPFHHTFEYVFKVNRVDCDGARDDHLEFSFPDKVTLIADSPPICDPGGVMGHRSWFGRLFRRHALD